jgi:hypothetical protein
VRLRDGTVLEATSVRITGSYVMLELADGRRVAYDVIDVDVEALLSGGDQETEDDSIKDSKERLSTGRSLKSADNVGKQAASGLTITDREVRHTRGSGVRGDDELSEEPIITEFGELPEGYQQGGQVLVNRVEVHPTDGGQWEVTGEVVNRNSDPVYNISVRLQTMPTPGEEAWRFEGRIANYLEPGEKVAFDQVFSALKPAERTHPDVRATVIWMERETGAAELGSPVPSRRRGSAPASEPTPIQ